MHERLHCNRDSSCKASGEINITAEGSDRDREVGVHGFGQYCTDTESFARGNFVLHLVLGMSRNCFSCSDLYANAYTSSSMLPNALVQCSLQSGNAAWEHISSSM